MSTHGKLAVLLAIIMVIVLRAGYGDYSDQSPMLDSVEHTAQEANK